MGNGSSGLTEEEVIQLAPVPGTVRSARTEPEDPGREPPRVDEETLEGIDLMAVGWIRRIILHRWFPSAIQFSLLMLLATLVALGWGQLAPAGAAEKLFAKVNAVTLLTWGLWWPVMVWVTVLLGRGWCAVCPLELASGWGGRLAGAAGFRRWRLAKRLRTGALALALYAVVHLLIAGVHINRVPAHTSWFFLGLILLAFVIGFFVRDRAFCRGFCPVSLLLKTYGRGGMVAVRRKAGSKYDGERCPNLLNPMKVSDSQECQGCCHCIKTSENQAMQLLLRRPFSRADARLPLASWPVTLFAMLDLGFVIFEVGEEWAASERVLLWVPERLAGWLQLESMAGWIEGVWIIGVFPILLWLVLGAMVLVARGAPSMALAWRQLALPMLVVSASIHMSKCVQKLASLGAYLPHAARDHSGASTASLLADGVLSEPAPLLSMRVVSILGATVLVVMAGFALRESRLAHPQGSKSRVLPLLCASLIGVVIVLHW
jgi:hypothetical protein